MSTDRLQGSLEDAPPTSSNSLSLQEVVGQGESQAEISLFKGLEEDRQSRETELVDTELILPNEATGIGSFDLESHVEKDTSSSSALPPLLTKESSRAFRVHQKAHHHRGKSVDVTLQGLTMALATIGEDLNEPVHDKPHEYTVDSPPQSSADDFVRNALRLHQPGSDQTFPTLLEETNYSPPTTEGSTGQLPSATSNQTSEVDIEAQAHSATTSNNSSSPRKRKNSKRKPNRRASFRGSISDNDGNDPWSSFNGFFRPRRKQLLGYLKTMVLFTIVPLVGVAGILFYLAGNPGTGYVEVGEESTSGKPSISWILLFCARQVVTFSIALAMQAFLVDFLALNTRILLRLVGPVLSLLIVQSRGWPMIWFWWAIANFCLVFGDSPTANHWGYYLQLDIFSDRNPSGSWTENHWYRSVLLCMISISIVVAVKRFLIGLYLGRKTYGHYGESLAQVMDKILLVTRVAGLARTIESFSNATNINDNTLEKPTFQGSFHWEQKTEEDSKPPPDSVSFLDTKELDTLTGNIGNSERIKLMELLGHWEEPERRSLRGKVSLQALCRAKYHRMRVNSFSVLPCRMKRHPFRPCSTFARH